MPDTGAAAGQQIEIAFRLRQSGAGLSYADATAFAAAGWALAWRNAQADVSFTYTLRPHTAAAAAAAGWHLVVLTLLNGEGPLVVVKPATGTGWAVEPIGYQVRAEQVDMDQVYNALLSSDGLAVVDTVLTIQDYFVTEGDSFTRELTVAEQALTLFGFDADDLSNDTLTLAGHVRATANRVGTPSAYLAVTVVTASAGSNPVLRLSWSSFPSGLAFPSTDPGDDADVPPAAFQYDVQAVGTMAWAVTAVSSGAKTFTVGGDRRRWFAVGGSLNKTSTDAGIYTVAAVSFAGGSTTVTVVEPIPVGTVNGNLEVDIKITLGKGTITVARQETRL